MNGQGFGQEMARMTEDRMKAMGDVVQQFTNPYVFIVHRKESKTW